MKNSKNRREFLKKASLGTLAAASFPIIPALAGDKLASKSVESSIGGCLATTLDFYGEGPFYTANAPVLAEGSLVDDNEPGVPLTISGVVRTLDCLETIANAEIDIWHADDSGAYDNEGYHLRGKVLSNAQGFYSFRTIVPGKYLNGNAYRPSHIHFKITPPGYPTLTTQIYFEGDEDIPGDAAASINSGTYDASERIISLSKNLEGEMEGTWDIIVDGESTNGIESLHMDKGVIYSVGPNPFTESLEIKYGVFNPSQVSVKVFDMQGRLVEELSNGQLTAEKYSTRWTPSAYTPGGTYWVALFVNDLQVSYRKVVKK